MSPLFSAALALVLLSAQDPKARDTTADAPIIQQRLRTCGHSEGPVRFLWETQAGAPAKAALAYACSRRGETVVLLYAPLPSGQYGLVCDSTPFAGVAHKLSGRVFGGRTFLHLHSIVFSPEEERDVEVVLEPRWGKCTTIAASDVRHPDDGPTLREPRAGIDFDDEGFDVWASPQRLEFRGEATIGPKRRVAMAMRGERYDAQKGDKGLTFAKSPIALEAYAPVTAEMSKNALSFARSRVRGVRVRFRGESVRVQAGEHNVLLDVRSKRWMMGPQLFGAGMLARATGSMAEEGVVFFNPPLELQEITLDAKGEVEAVIVFQDGEDWPLFEAHEDFGESHSADAPKR